MAGQSPPEQFAHLVNLAADITGTFVAFATDDYFAPKENLIKPDAPVWQEGLYTDRGKWMDGWESQRMRGPGYDHVIVRLGTPGTVEGILVDTTHFKGNAPQEVSLEVTEALYTANPQQLAQATWTVVLERTPIQSDHANALKLPKTSGRATHVRLNIFPDGGVSRLRVYGTVLPDVRTFWREGGADLAAVENGGVVASVSDQFFGPPANMLLPGRGVNMGDGWETRRRRTPGSDWCVVKLGRRAVLDRIEVDTHFFKGNAPQAARIDWLDSEGMDDGELQRRLHGVEGWEVLVANTPLVQHRRHVLEPDRPACVTHLRVHIFPHGGVNRLRAFGHAVDTPEERGRLEAFHTMADQEVRTLLLSFNGCAHWAEAMAGARPLASVRSLFSTADKIWWGLEESHWLEAYAAHPRIGDNRKAATQTEQGAAWSRGEQRGMHDAADAVKERLAELNQTYAERMGFIFICCATGRSAAQMLELLERRLTNTRAQEIENAAREQARITRLRVEKWLNNG